MKEKNRQILKAAIDHLPQHKFPQEFRWELIGNRTDSTPAERLPEFKAPDNLWPRIEAALESEKNPVRIFQIFKWVAAAAIVLIVLSTIFTMAPTMESLMKKGMAKNSRSADMPFATDNPLLQNVSQRAGTNPQFMDLENQLMQVDIEIQKIKGFIRTDDPRMLKYYYRLENTRVEIEKKLLKIILET